MKDYLIVDGYNVLNNWPELAALKEQSLEHARDRLIAILSNYQALKGIEVVVVFDGHQVKGNTGTRERIGGVEVIYSREGETADVTIERLVSQLPSGAVATVATSDWVEQRMVMAKGALRLSARELHQEIAETAERAYQGAADPKADLRKLDQKLPEELRGIFEEWRRRK